MTANVQINTDYVVTKPAAVSAILDQVKNILEGALMRQAMERKGEKS